MGEFFIKLGEKYVTQSNKEDHLTILYYTKTLWTGIEWQIDTRRMEKKAKGSHRWHKRQGRTRILDDVVKSMAGKWVKSKRPTWL